MKRIVTIQDISCVGRCSLTEALPVISAMGVECSVIPTAVLSTHTAFPKFTFCDLTEEIPAITEAWKEMSLDFDAVYTGYLGSDRQIALVKDFVRDFGEKEGFITWIDPVMADHGKMYAGFSEDFASKMALLCAGADVIVPNMTEAAFMLGIPYAESYDEAYVTELCEKLCGEPTALSPYGVKTSGQVTSLYGYDDGLFYVQDEASQLCAMALGANPQEVVVDTCSCPGSKSFGLALDMKNEGKIYSFDLHENKLSLVSSSAKRLGIDIIETEARDARKPRAELVGKAHRVLCDVPCSGFGVFAKKPELRYKDVEKCKGLPKIQREILNTACRYVKEGGLLVYSTCTLLPEENEENIHAFLAAHSEFSCLRMRTLTPDVDETDGFFFAVLQKATKQ